MKRIKSLDGIRAISILMLLFAHSLGTVNPKGLSNKEYNLLYSEGGLSVINFFVISGYLITKMLLIEREKRGNISLKNFYLRRLFRVFPVFYLYIIVMIILKCFFIPTLFENYTVVGFASLYLWNYVHVFNVHALPSDHVTFIFGHFWSLAVEEQFYLLWPIMLIVLNVKTLKKVVIVMILITPLLRTAAYFLIPGDRGKADAMILLAGGNSILIGCLGALIENTNFFKEKILKIIYNKSLIFFTAIFLFIISPLLAIYLGGSYVVPVGNSLISVCILILIFWLIYVPSKVADFFNIKAMVHLGLLSYSIYVWQQLFLNGGTHFWFNRFPQNIPIIFAVAYISYYLVEMPVLKLKKRFERI
jgi:peptidoglycan/LPS O-acetylase OafA/YrhL